MKTNHYGMKGGTSRTAGRKAETITATFVDGSVRTKRVFFGQRALTLCADEQGEIVQAHSDMAAAMAYLARVPGDMYPAQLAAAASTV